MDRFLNRDDAGRRLAEAVAVLGLRNPVVLALPRGGVPVARHVAERLKAPLDLILVRKIGAPMHEELAMGAVVDGDPPQVVWNRGVLAELGLDPKDLDKMVAGKVAEIDERRERYLGGRPPVSVAGRDAVVVDDGIATGSTVRAALKALRSKHPSSITLAVPVAPAETAEDLNTAVDHMVCLARPRPFFAVGAHYVDFRQTSDDEVTRTLDTANKGGGA